MTATEFVAALRRLKCWSGLSYRQLGKVAERHGRVLPRTTISTALDQGRPPSEPLLVAFVLACGCGQAEVDEWVLARKRVLAPDTTEDRSPAPVVAGSCVLWTLAGIALVLIAGGIWLVTRRRAHRHSG